MGRDGRVLTARPATSPHDIGTSEITQNVTHLSGEDDCDEQLEGVDVVERNGGIWVQRLENGLRGRVSQRLVELGRRFMSV